MSDGVQNNVQLNPVGKFFLPIDKLNKNIFDFTKNGKLTRLLVENRRPEIVTKISLSDANLNQFDRLIFCAAVSEYLASNKNFTIRRIFQKIGGSHTLTEPMKKMIENSLNKLRNTDCEIDMTAINQKHKYTKETKLKFKNYLLPCKSLEIKINGQSSETAFEFIDEPDLLKIAELKRQFIQCDVKLLEVPNLRNTENTMKLKIYLLSRALEIIGSHKHHKAHFVGRNSEKQPIYKRAKKLSRTILIDTIFKQCGLSDGTYRQKQQAKETIEKILNHFQRFGLITKFVFLSAKNRESTKNEKIHSIKIEFC